MKYEEVIHRCFRCGYCKLTSNFSDINCPSYKQYGFETYSPGGKMWLLRAWLKNDIKWTKNLAKAFYSCVTCKNCVENCVFEFKDNLVDIFIAAREEMVEKGMVPPEVRDYLSNIHIYGNPFKKPQYNRGEWINKTGSKEYTNEEYLLYVGCVGSYDERATKITRNLSCILETAGVSFGVLGNDEVCDGNDVKICGETGLFEILAKRNIEIFTNKGIHKIVTLSPHAYNVFKNDYPELGGNYNVIHYTNLFVNLIKDDRISFNNYKGEKIKVAYHDSCFLGRYNNEYEAPRLVLKAIPSIELIEMDRNKRNALCCGGGGGNYFTDILSVNDENSPSRIRVREAVGIGVQVIAVACPICAIMLDDAVKTEWLDDKIKIKDISEIVRDNMA